MPELPEVETIVRSLRDQLVGVELAGVWSSGLPLHLRRPVDAPTLAKVSRGARVQAIRRRGKYVLIDLVRGSGPTGGVLVHLGMSGRLRVQGKSEARDRHTHVAWQIADGRELRFVDPRRFGWVRPTAATLDALPELAALGPDPLAELTSPALALALERSRAPVKAFLLDQRRIAGLGNIYVCEALFRAGVHPRRPAARARPSARALFDGIKEALETGIRNRGTTLRDYVDAGGGAGQNQHALLVYGREGQRCAACEAVIRRIVDAGRSTFFCPRCQRR